MFKESAEDKRGSEQKVAIYFPDDVKLKTFCSCKCLSFNWIILFLYLWGYWCKSTFKIAKNIKMLNADWKK